MKATLFVILLAILLSTKVDAFGEQLYKNDAYGITFSYPERWEAQWLDGRNKVTHDPFDARFEPTGIGKDDLRFDIIVDNYAYDRVMEAGSLMKYCQDMLIEYPSRHKVSIGPKCERVNLNGSDGIKMEIIFDSFVMPSETGLVYLKNVREIWHFFIKNNTLYILKFWGRESVYNSMKDNIERAISSFTIRAVSPISKK